MTGKKTFDQTYKEFDLILADLFYYWPIVRLELREKRAWNKNVSQLDLDIRDLGMLVSDSMTPSFKQANIVLNSWMIKDQRKEMCIGLQELWVPEWMARWIAGRCPLWLLPEVGKWHWVCGRNLEDD